MDIICRLADLIGSSGVSKWRGGWHDSCCCPLWVNNGKRVINPNDFIIIMNNPKQTSHMNNRGYARDITVAGSYVGTRLLSGKTLISAIDSPYIQTEKSYLIVLNKVNSPTLRLYWKLELSSFYLQSFCFIKIHHRHVMSYFLSRHSVQVFIFPSVRVWKHSFSTTQHPAASCIMCKLETGGMQGRWVICNKHFQTPMLHAAQCFATQSRLGGWVSVDVHTLYSGGN